MPVPTPGREYALTHIHVGYTEERLHTNETYSATPETFSAWIDAAPNLRHYGCTHGFCDGMGIGFLEAAAAATNLETLDLAEWGAQDDETTDAARLKRIMSALPPNLRIVPYGAYPGGDPMFDNAIGDALRAAARAAGRMDLEILKFSTTQHALENVFDASSTRRPMLWDWFEAIKPLCYA